MSHEAEGSADQRKPLPATDSLNSKPTPPTKEPAEVEGQTANEAPVVTEQGESPQPVPAASEPAHKPAPWRLPTKDRLALLEAHSPAREIASKVIGRHAVPWIAFLVLVGVIASYFLDKASLPAVIGLVSTSVMALIAMVTGITGTKEKDEKPEFVLMQKLIDRLSEKEAEKPVKVRVLGDRVIVTHGDDTVETSANPPKTE